MKSIGTLEAQFTSSLCCRNVIMPVVRPFSHTHARTYPHAACLTSTPQRLSAAVGGEQGAADHIEPLPVIPQQQHRNDASQPGVDQSQQQQFQQVLAEVQQLSYMELQHLLDDQQQHRAFTASFLFWLSALEKKAAGQHKQVCA